MLTNEQIEGFFRDCDLNLIDCVCKDQLPDKRYICDYVINMQNSDAGSGSHWVFCKITSSSAIYFDSFGVYCPEEVKNFIHPLKIVYNTRQIQDLKSEMCGFFSSACGYYLKYDSDPKKQIEDNFEDFLTMFSDDTKKNDAILKEYLKKNSVWKLI